MKNANDFIHNYNEDSWLLERSFWDIISKIFKIIYVVVLQWDSKKKITDIAGRKYKTIIIYDLHDEQNKERRNERQRTEEMVKPFPRLYVLPIFVFMNSERSELWIKMKIGNT